MKINPIVIALVGVLLLGGLFLIFKPQNQNQTPENASVATQEALPQSNIKTFELVVEGKKLVSGPETISVNEGDEVVIKVTSDEPEEFHIHGYDKFVDLKKNEPAELLFTADLTGRFIYELEHSKTDIGALEVTPN